MRKTGDLIIDTVLKNFCELARSAVQGRRSVDVEDCLERAISGACAELKRSGIKEKEVRERIWPEEDGIRVMCRKNILAMEKRGSLLDIRKASVDALLEDFVHRTGWDMTYKLRNNNSVGFCIKLQPSAQYLKFSAAYSKVLSPGWLDETEADLRKFMSITARLGRICVSARNC